MNLRQELLEKLEMTRERKEKAKQKLLTK